MNEQRVVYGYLNKAFVNTINEQGKVDKGLIKIIFEELNGKLSPINSEADFDTLSLTAKPCPCLLNPCPRLNLDLLLNAQC